MAKRKQKKAAARAKTRTGSKKVKRASKKKAKAAPKVARAKKASRKQKASANRREHRRYSTPNLWVTEYQADYQFSAAVGDLSEGGLFLKSRIKMSSSQLSQLKIHFGEQGSIDVTAKPVYDRTTKDSYGTGYQFTELSPAQTNFLRTYLRNLD